MTRFNEWLAELERATRKRIENSNIKLFEYQIELVSKIKILEFRKYKFVIIGPKGRFTVDQHGFIFGIRSNYVNKKEKYGHVDTFEEFDWEPYYPVRKALYEWQAKEPEKEKRPRKRTPVTPVKIGPWIYTTGDGKTVRSKSPDATELGNQGIPSKRSSKTNDRS